MSHYIFDESMNLSSKFKCPQRLSLGRNESPGTRSLSNKTWRRALMPKFFPHSIACIELHWHSLILCQVLENRKWGIEGNWKVLLGNAMQVDAAWCGQFAKSERLWAMSTHPVRSVIFVYLNSCKRFTLNLPPETLEATCSVLFCQFLVQKAQVGVVIICSILMRVAARKPNHLIHLPFAFSALPGSGKRRSEPKPPKPLLLCKHNVVWTAYLPDSTSWTYPVWALRTMCRPWIIFVLHPGRGRFANWPHFKTQRSQDLVMMNNSWNFRVGLWILQLQVLPELWQVHILHFRTSLRHRIFKTALSNVLEPVG